MEDIPKYYIPNIGELYGDTRQHFKTNTYLRKKEKSD